MTHTREQVAAELGDVAFGALVTASSMGFDPRQVLAATAAKVAARFGFPAPWADTTPHQTAPPATPPNGDSGSAEAAARGGGSAGEDLFSRLLDIAQAQTRQHPQHQRALAQVTRLVEAAGEAALQVDHAEDTGISTLQHGPFDPARLAAELADVLQAAAALTTHYDLTNQVATAIVARHTRYRDQGLIPAPAAVAAGCLSQPASAAELLGP